MSIKTLKIERFVNEWVICRIIQINEERRFFCVLVYQRLVQQIYNDDHKLEVILLHFKPPFRTIVLIGMVNRKALSVFERKHSIP